METDAAADRLRLLECARDLALQMGAIHSQAMGLEPGPGSSGELAEMSEAIFSWLIALRDSPAWDAVFRWQFGSNNVMPARGFVEDGITRRFVDPTDAVDAVAEVLMEDLSAAARILFGDAPQGSARWIANPADATAEFCAILRSYPDGLFERLADWCDISRGKSTETLVRETGLVPSPPPDRGLTEDFPLIVTGNAAVDLAQELRELGDRSNARWYAEAAADSEKNLESATRLMGHLQTRGSVAAGDSPEGLLHAKLHLRHLFREGGKIDWSLFLFEAGLIEQVERVRRVSPAAAALMPRADRGEAIKDPERFVDEFHDAARSALRILIEDRQRHASEAARDALVEAARSGPPKAAADTDANGGPGQPQKSDPPPDPCAMYRDRLVTIRDIAKVVESHPKTVDKRKREWPAPAKPHAGGRSIGDRWRVGDLLDVLRVQFPDTKLDWSRLDDADLGG